MDRTAFGSVQYDFSDPTVAAAKHKTSTEDAYAASASKAYLKSAFAGTLVPYDPKLLTVQSSALQTGLKMDPDTIAKIQQLDPGGEWDEVSDMMSDSYYSSGGGSGGSSTPSGSQSKISLWMNEHKSWVIAGSILVSGLALIWYVRK